MYVLEKIDSKTPKKQTRVCGKNEYEIEYYPVNGDTYEQVLIDSSIGVKTEAQAKFKLLRGMREKMLKAVAGEAYTDACTREWPAWLLADVNDFVWDYLQGNV